MFKELFYRAPEWLGCCDGDVGGFEPPLSLNQIATLRQNNEVSVVWRISVVLMRLPYLSDHFVCSSDHIALRKASLV